MYIYCIISTAKIDTRTLAEIVHPKSKDPQRGDLTIPFPPQKIYRNSKTPTKWDQTMAEVVNITPIYV